MRFWSFAHGLEVGTFRSSAIKLERVFFGGGDSVEMIWRGRKRERGRGRGYIRMRVGAETAYDGCIERAEDEVC